MTGVFPSVLKTTKVVPVFKKDSKLDYSNYRPTIVHHFADDTNLICLSKSIKKLNKLVNAYLKYLVN